MASVSVLSNDDNSRSVENRENDIIVNTDEISINQHNVDIYINDALRKTLTIIRDTPNKKCTDIERLAPHIRKYGLTSTQIGQLLDVIFYQRNLSFKKTYERISLLLPRTTVPEKQIIRIYGNLSCRDYPAEIMQALLKWVVLIYNYIDGKTYINKMYCVLFFYLNLEKIRPQICSILFLMTKKIHVKQYRIRFLLELADKMAIDPYIGMLLTVYRNFRPDFELPDKYKSSRKKAYTTTDPLFEARLTQIRQLWLDDTTPAPTPTVFEESDQPQTDKRRQKRRTLTKSNIQTVKNAFDPSEILTYMDRQSVTEQILGALSNRMIQHVIICKPNDVVIPRLCDILAQQLMNNLYWNRQTSKSYQALESILHKILKLARLTKAHIPVVEQFLTRYLRSWNGIDCVNEIFELITYIKPSSFHEIFESYLKPLNRLYCISDVRWKAKLILCYRDWLKHWALLDWHRHMERRKAITNESIEHAVDDLTWLFQGLSFNIDYFDVMQQMIYHVDRLCVQGLTLEQDHPLLQHASLSFFEFTASISLQHDIPAIVIPAASLVYRSFFSSNAMAISRICDVLYKYKLSFELNDRQVQDWMDRNGEEYMEHFNTYVLDICNCLWRNLAFNYHSEDATAFSLSGDTIMAFQKKCEERDDPFHLLFSLTHSSAFVGYSKQFMKRKAVELEIPIETSVPVTVDSIKFLANDDQHAMTYMDYRVEYLDYLKDLGFGGVYDLLYTFMASLIERKQMEAEPTDSDSSIL